MEPETQDRATVVAAEGSYQAPQVLAAGSATSRVQGWGFGHFDCHYASFYWSPTCE